MQFGSFDEWDYIPSHPYGKQKSILEFLEYFDWISRYYDRHNTTQLIEVGRHSKETLDESTKEILANGGYDLSRFGFPIKDSVNGFIHDRPGYIHRVYSENGKDIIYYQEFTHLQDMWKYDMYKMIQEAIRESIYRPPVVIDSLYKLMMPAKLLHVDDVITNASTREEHETFYFNRRSLKALLYYEHLLKPEFHGFNAVGDCTSTTYKKNRKPGH